MGAVEDGVQLGVADIHIFRVQRLTLPLPRHGVVVAADGHTVVAQREDLVFRADDAGAHLTAGVLGAHGREQGNAHKVFVPVDVIRAFHRVVLLVLHKKFCIKIGFGGPIIACYGSFYNKIFALKAICTKQSREVWQGKSRKFQMKYSKIV